MADSDIFIQVPADGSGKRIFHLPRTIDGIAVHVPTVTTEGLATRFDSSASPLIYLGQAVPGSLTSAAAWQVQRIDVTSGVIILFADGDQSFDNIWDDRASLAYS